MSQLVTTLSAVLCVVTNWADQGGGTASADLFDDVDNFTVQNQIDWEKCVGVCTDGGRSVSGYYQGLQA
ncbi:hypothetical protein lerEdw1_018888 [Lerista edwardsae]|nr:hypothetical protein lerEdw1_018888 [Lerista edwardsae]